MSIEKINIFFKPILDIFSSIETSCTKISKKLKNFLNFFSFNGASKPASDFLKTKNIKAKPLFNKPATDKIETSIAKFESDNKCKLADDLVKKVRTWLDQNPHDNKLIIQVSADSEEDRKSINLIMKDYSIIYDVPKKTCFCHVIEVIENESLKIFNEFLSGYIVEQSNPTKLEEKFTFSFLKTTKKTDIFSKIINLFTSQPISQKKYLVGSSAEKNHIPKEFTPNFYV